MTQARQGQMDGRKLHGPLDLPLHQPHRLYRSHCIGGPRQNVVAWLGALDDAGRLGVLQAARCIDDDPVSNVDSSKFFQQSLFEFEDTPVEPRWVRVNTNAVRVENSRSFGGPWLALQLIQQLKLDKFLNKQLPKGKEHIQWSITAMILVIARLLDPSSELYISEQWYPKTALPD